MENGSSPISNFEFSIFPFFGNFLICCPLCSGCGSFGKAVASDTRDPGFKSSHQQVLFNINCIKFVLKIPKERMKRPGMAHCNKNKGSQLLLKLKLVFCRNSFIRSIPVLTRLGQSRKKFSWVKISCVGGNN